MSDVGLLDMLIRLNQIISELAQKSLRQDRKISELQSEKLKLELAVYDKDKSLEYVVAHTTQTFRACVEYDADGAVNLEATKKAWETRASKKSNASPPAAPPESS